MSEWGTYEEVEGHGGSFRWFHPSKTQRSDCLVLCEGWIWYDAHYMGHGYARCVGDGCHFCASNFPRQKRIILGVRPLGRIGQWALEMPAGAGMMIQEIAAERKGIQGVVLQIRREGQGGRGEWQVRDSMPNTPKGTEGVSPQKLLGWLENLEFWNGFQNLRESRDPTGKEGPPDLSAGT